jgi:formylglycine-generating enzyme required for sulfatase activity
MSADAAALMTDLKCDSARYTWTTSVGSKENQPIDCVNWYVAFAFCIWDEGRLPTEAEWNYAAAGGSEQRVYPWGATPPDCSYANFGGTNFPTTACVLPGTGLMNNVGSESPKGDGKWGQADLAGNLWEWRLDWYATPYPQVPCVDCANMTAATNRIIRGGGFASDASRLLSSDRDNNVPTHRSGNGGIRCARSAP